MPADKKHSGLTGNFSERLYQARTAAGLSQSDLAREVWGVQTTTEGYEVAKNRDRISSYERGKSAPKKDNLMKLADVLGVQVEH